MIKPASAAKTLARVGGSSRSIWKCGASCAWAKSGASTASARAAAAFTI
jgi:hypothetical protein